jgi:hypothetical protein
MRTRYWILVPFLLLAWQRPALAADRVQECIGEHVEAQLLRQQGRWVAAQARLLECAQPTCPALVREECATLSREIESQLPSVVLGAVDARGQSNAEPLVSIDGSRELVPLDGQPIPLDPGEHHFRFEHPQGGVRELVLVLAESERERPVIADYRRRTARDETPDGRRWPSPVLWVSAGVATAALGSFTYFALAGRSIESDLDRCKPNCESQADIDRMRSRYLLADVSLGVALVSLGVGAYAWTQLGSPAPSERAPGAARSSLRLEPVASPSSVGLWATGEF